MASVFLVGRRSLGKQNEQSMAKASAKILVKCEGNNSPKYDGKIWEEEIKYIVDVNGQSIDSHSQQEIKPGDRVIIRRPGKGGRRARSWHGTVMSESDVEEASRQAVKQPSSKRKRKTNSGDDSNSGSSKKPKCKYHHRWFISIPCIFGLHNSLMWCLYNFKDYNLWN